MNFQQVSWILPVGIALTVVASLAFVLVSGPPQAAKPLANAAALSPPRPASTSAPSPSAAPAKVRPVASSKPASALPPTAIPTLNPEVETRTVRIEGEIVLVDSSTLPDDVRSGFSRVPDNARRDPEFLLASVNVIDPASRAIVRTDTSGQFTMTTDVAKDAVEVLLLLDSFFLMPVDKQVLRAVTIMPGGDAHLRVEMVHQPAFNLRMPDGRMVTDELMADPEVMKWLKERLAVFQLEIATPKPVPTRPE